EENSIQPFWGQPFTSEIDETHIPPNFREIVVEPFDGTQDPYAHLQAFQAQMYISGGDDRLSCKLFSDTLRGVAMQWMATLSTKSIQTFSDLAGSFVSQFAANKMKKLESEKLFSTVQQRDSLGGFVKAFQKGLRAGSFNDALALRRPTSMEEIRARAEKHVEVEEDQLGRREAERDFIHREVRCPTQAKDNKRPMPTRA
ncbi:hypothetical protein CR513_61913, partial [Mucuna pruriens]